MNSLPPGIVYGDHATIKFVLLLVGRENSASGQTEYEAIIESVNGSPILVTHGGRLFSATLKLEGIRPIQNPAGQDSLIGAPMTCDSGRWRKNSMFIHSRSCYRYPDWFDPGR
jgi:hypothetical protein